MAQEEVTSKTKIDFIFDELQNTYDLLDKFKNLDLKNKEFKRFNHILIKEKEEYLKEKKFLLKENQDLKKEIKILKSIIEKLFVALKTSNDFK